LKKPSKIDYVERHNLCVNQILAVLNLARCGRFWHQPTGAAYREGKLIHYGLKGCADISGILKGGYRVEIEVKTGKAKQQINQKHFEKNIHMWGGIYFVARSPEDALKSLKIEAMKRGVKID
jgi:hypothetical protein